jgi:hypothetical protein
LLSFREIIELANLAAAAAL